jgi:short-subunit dehydrogenase
VADQAAAVFDRIDTWVQVAGISIYARLEDTTPQEWSRIIDVNLNGQAYAAMAALPYLRQQGGALICVSSVEARRALPFQAAYAASKHGIKAMCEALRQELQADGVPVSVTEILPATINTPLFDHARTKIGVKPMGVPPVYPPESVAKLILYAAQHPVRELVVGGAARVLIAGQKVSPSLMDSLLGRVTYEKQQTTHPKSAEDADNMFHPIDEDQSVQGSFTHMQRAGSMYSWVATHPWHVGALAMGVLGYAAVASRGEEKPRRRAGRR